MRLAPLKLDRYFIREMIVPFCTWMLALLVLVEGNFLFLLLKAAKSRDLPLLQIVLFLAFRLPFSIVLSIPMSYLFAACLSITRLAADEELTACRVAGMSPGRVMATFVVAGLLAAVGSFGINEFIVPWANHISQNSVRQMFLRQAQLTPEANLFIQGPEGFTFYSGDVSVRENTMRDAMVFRPSGSGYPDLWIAETATFDDNRIYMRNVRMYSFNDRGSATRCGRAEEQMMDLKEMLDVWYRDQRDAPEELSYRELAKRVRELKAAGHSAQRQEYELHSKLSIPCATLVFVMLGAPLSLRFGRRGGFAGTVIALTMIFTYYCFMAWGRILGQAGSVSPFLGAWTQNIVFGALGLFFMWRWR